MEWGKSMLISTRYSLMPGSRYSISYSPTPLLAIYGLLLELLQVDVEQAKLGGYVRAQKVSSFASFPSTELGNSSSFHGKETITSLQHLSHRAKRTLRQQRMNRSLDLPVSTTVSTVNFLFSFNHIKTCLFF